MNKDGSVYKGQLLDDEANGYGEKSFKDGTLIKGFWMHDKQHGITVTIKEGKPK